MVNDVVEYACLVMNYIINVGHKNVVMYLQ